MQLVASRVRSSQYPKQALERALAKLGDPHTNGGETEVLREWNVVEARDGDVPRNLPAGAAKGFNGADRHIVVCRENGVELDAVVEQCPDRPLAGTLHKNLPAQPEATRRNGG